MTATSKTVTGRKRADLPTGTVSQTVLMMPTMSALFDPEPSRWGLRGDPHLWRALREHLASTGIPATDRGVVMALNTAIFELSGIDLASDPAASAYREQYAHGGMSSGMISLDAWRDSLIPLLTERARTRRHP